MERVRYSRHFDVPAERAYAYTTDLRNLSRFLPGFVSMDASSRAERAGDVAHLRMRLLGRERAVQITFERFELNRSFAYTSRQEGLPAAHHERSFTPDGRGFRFDMSVAYEPRNGVLGLIDRLVVKRAVRRLLRRTADELELALA